MSVQKPILVELLPNGVATLTLSREENHHAFNLEMVQSITETLNQLESNDNVRLLVLRATGKIFCAGMDLHWLQNQNDTDELAIMMAQLANFKKPTLAIVQGPAWGGGIGLIACCQCAIVSSTATFCFSEVKLGIIPAVIAPYVIKAIGFRHTLSYFLSAKSFDAQTALRMGLCQEIASPENLEKISQEWITALLQGGPLAQQSVIQYLDNRHFEHAAKMLSELRKSEEGQEGLQAFLEKRKPKWTV